MKKTSLTFLLLIPTLLFGQTFGINSETQLLTFEQVIKADSMKADDIYNKVKEWAVLTFKNSEKVIVGDNKPTLIKATFIQKYFNGMGVYADYYNTMTIKIKDGAVKVIIDDMKMTSGFNIESTLYKKDGTLKPGQTFQKIHQDVESKCKGLIEDLSKFMTKKSDW